jgi:hypothetical protein
MMITADAYQLASDLAHWRIAMEVRLPLEEVIETDERGETTYTPAIMQLYLNYKEHYLTALKDYEHEH